MRNIFHKKKAKIITPNGKFETITLKPTKTHRQENNNDSEKNDCEMFKAKDDEEYFIDEVDKKKKVVKKVNQICNCPCDVRCCFF